MSRLKQACEEISAAQPKKNKKMGCRHAELIFLVSIVEWAAEAQERELEKVALKHIKDMDRAASIHD